MSRFPTHSKTQEVPENGKVLSYPPLSLAEKCSPELELKGKEMLVLIPRKSAHVAGPLACPVCAGIPHLTTYQCALRGGELNGAVPLARIISIQPGVRAFQDWQIMMPKTLYL